MGFTVVEGCSRVRRGSGELETKLRLGEETDGEGIGHAAEVTVK